MISLVILGLTTVGARSASAGSCCNSTTGVCTDDVDVADCDGPDEDFSIRTCCHFARPVCNPPTVGDYPAINVELLGLFGIDELGFLNDIWGYVSPSGREYAIVGLVRGTAFFEVTDPFNPVLIDIIPDAESIWSDMRCYQEYCYNVNESSGGLQVFSMENIDRGIVQLVNAITNPFQTSHNIAVDEQSGFLYACGVEVLSQGVVIMDLANPAAPSFVGGIAANCHDIFPITYNAGTPEEQEVLFFFGGAGTRIFDVTDKAAISLISAIPGFENGFNHQGWLSEDLSTLFWGQEFAPVTVHMADVSDLGNPVFLGDFQPDSCSIDHNMMIENTIAYQATYTTGLQVYDVSNPPNISRVGLFDTLPENNAGSFNGAWGVYSQLPSGVVLVSDQSRGLFVLNYDCNRNGIDDTTEIDDELVADCNSNGLPDSCEFDCNSNGFPDDCDIAEGRSQDTNFDGVPDECPCVSPLPAALSEPSYPRNRFLSVEFDVDVSSVAVRVVLDSLHHPDPPYAGGNQGANLSGFEGTVRWAGTPTLHEQGNSGGAFWTSQLQCEPEFMDLTSIDVLNLFGPEVVPSSAYTVQLVYEQCSSSLDDPASFSMPVVAETSRWGDVTDPFSPDTEFSQPDIADVLEAVDKFLGTSPRSKASTRTQPETIDPELHTSLSDILSIVDAFLGKPYPFTIATTCP